MYVTCCTVYYSLFIDVDVIWLCSLCCILYFTQSLHKYTPILYHTIPIHAPSTSLMLTLLYPLYPPISTPLPTPHTHICRYQFNDPDSPYFIFLLSTRAGGLGLNLVCSVYTPTTATTIDACVCY